APGERRRPVGGCVRGARVGALRLRCGRGGAGTRHSRRDRRGSPGASCRRPSGRLRRGRLERLRRTPSGGFAPEGGDGPRAPSWRGRPPSAGPELAGAARPPGRGETPVPRQRRRGRSERGRVAHRGSIRRDHGQPDGHSADGDGRLGRRPDRMCRRPSRAGTRGRPLGDRRRLPPRPGGGASLRRPGRRWPPLRRARRRPSARAALAAREAGRREAEGGRRLARDEVTRSEAETERFGEELAAEGHTADVLYLIRRLGAGKTPAAPGTAPGLGASEREVASPTFAILNEYASASGSIVLRHLDLYRLKDEEKELEILGLPGAVHNAPVAVEWPGTAISRLLPATMEISLEVLP